MKSYLIKIIYSVLLLILICPTNIYPANMDPILERLDISGFLRIRYWNVLSKTKIPDKFMRSNTYQSVNYFDVFFRNRINLNIIPEAEIKTVFDISAKFGKSDFSLGEGSTNLITRDVYAVLRPYGNLKIKIGLLPFSLPGGYILARDATGLEYIQSLFQKKLIMSFAYIKAFDNADDNFGQESYKPDYVWDDIFIARFKFKIGSHLLSDIYYVYEDDRYTSDTSLLGDNRKGSLHWAGIHNKMNAGNWFCTFGFIYNAGYMYIRDINNFFRTIHVSAGLAEFETGYSFKTAQISIIAEGASGDPNNANAGISFQDIKSSHGFSYIAIDNTGGLALRGSGESSWYGLFGAGVKLKYTILDSVTLNVNLLHFGTTKYLYWRNKPSLWYGDEIDFKAEYKYQNIMSIFLTAAGFLPQRAYNSLNNMNRDWWGNMRQEYKDFLNLTADPLQGYRPILNDWDNDGSRSMIFEIMFGVKITYN